MSEINNQYKKRSLWREGFRLFFAHGREWSKWMIWILIIHLGLNFTDVHNLMNLSAYMKEHPQSGKTIDPELFNHLRPVMILLFLRIFLDWIALYVFSVFFWNRVPVGPRSVPSVGGGLMFFLRYIQILASIFILTLGAAAVFLIAAFIVKFTMGVGFLWGLLLFLSGIAAVGSLIYWGCRYFLALNLAANRINHPLKSALALTKGRAWPAFKAACIMSFALFLVMVPIIPLSILASKVGADPETQAIAQYAFHFLHSIIMMIVDGLWASFLCVATSIFYDQKRTADPHFVLETKA